MRTALLILALMLFLGEPLLHAQQQAVMSWPAPPDATSASSYYVYRAVGDCKLGFNALTWTKIASTSSLTYTDTPPAPGVYCYYIRQQRGGALSEPPTTSHKAVLAWTAPPDATSSSTYAVYRAMGNCQGTGLGTLTWHQIATTSQLTYTDNSLPPGAWCYYVVQQRDGGQSGPSIVFGGIAKPAAITLLFPVTVT
jgi:hypothetical protein